MAWLYRQKGFSPEMLEDEEVREFIKKTAALLDNAVDLSVREVPLDEVSVQRLKESDYVFSGIKTFHELNEAFPSLLDEDGGLKPFERFLNDVQTINDTYNGAYLKTEWNFARSSALMAAKWKDFEKDGEDYNLQYRTAGDERVRKGHRPLDGITLPLSQQVLGLVSPAQRVRMPLHDRTGPQREVSGKRREGGHEPRIAGHIGKVPGDDAIQSGETDDHIPGI